MNLIDPNFYGFPYDEQVARLTSGLDIGQRHLRFAEGKKTMCGRSMNGLDVLPLPGPAGICHRCLLRWAKEIREKRAEVPP